jgi:taurine--2-oxoglutarate transaminase
MWAIELVRDRDSREMYVPYNAAGADAEPMARLAAECRKRGLWPFTHFNRIHVVPPLTIDEVDLKTGLDILDDVLDVADGLCS